MASSQSLEDYRWKKRILFIVNPLSVNIADHPQVKAFDGYKDEIRERHMLIFVIKGNSMMDLQGNWVDLELNGLETESFQGLLLIGKDGGVKLREAFTVRPEQIFSLIDSMPMRQAEIKASEKY